MGFPPVVRKIEKSGKKPYGICTRNELQIEVMLT